MTPYGQQKGTCLQAWPLVGNDTSPWIRSQERSCLWYPWACSQGPAPKPAFLEPGPCSSKGYQAGMPHSDAQRFIQPCLEWLLVPKTQSCSLYCHHWRLGPCQVMPTYLEPFPSSGLDSRCQVAGGKCQAGSCAVNLHGEKPSLKCTALCGCLRQTLTM